MAFGNDGRLGDLEHQDEEMEDVYDRPNNVGLL